MEIKKAQNQADWDNWLKSNTTNHPFSQSFDWGEILFAEGEKIERLAVIEGDNVVAEALVIYKPLPFGWQYAFCPKGVAIESRTTNHESRIYETLINYLQNKKCIFFRIEPSHLPIIHNSKFLIHQSIDINPRTTAILNLQQTDEALLNTMRKNTRYSIRFADKQNLVIKEEKNLELFWNLLQQTAKHDSFTTHSKKHYEAIFNSSSIYQLTAFKDNIAVATAVFIGFGDTFTYLFAASDYNYHQLLAPYLLQWEAIKLGQKLGYKYYDLFGIAPRTKGVKNKEKGNNCHAEFISASNKTDDMQILKQVQNDSYKYDEKHPYAGITRFKLGFGGDVKEFPGTFDVVVDKQKYLLYKFLRTVRRLF